MAGTFQFELVSPERIVLSADADQVVLPASEGQMTVLPQHSPVITSLRPGFVEVTQGGSRSRVFVKGGFAEVMPDATTVLAETAIDAGELNGARLADELRVAEAELAEAKSDQGRTFAYAAVEQLRQLSGNKAG